MVSSIRTRHKTDLRDCGNTQSAQALSHKAYIWGLSLTAALPMFWAACARDTRLSVHEFMELEQHAPVPPTTQPAAPATQPADMALQPWNDGIYRVGPDDVLTVVIAGLETIGLPESYTVRCNQKGEIVLPSIGTVAVSGMSLDEIEAELQKRYSPEHIRDAQVAVQVTTYGTTPVLVLGDVTVGPPAVQLRRDQTSVLQAVLAAGGPMDFGGQVTLIPARAPEEAVIYDLSHRADIVEAAKVGVVEAADIIVVDNRPNDAVYVLGLVNMPGPVPVPRAASISVLQALGAVGGTLLAYEPKEATLMRRRPDGELVRVKLNLHRLLQGEEPDIRLAAGDVLLVPHTAATRFEEFLARNFVMRFGVDATFNPWTHYYFREDRTLRRDGRDGDIFSTFGRYIGGLTPVPSPGGTGP